MMHDFVAAHEAARPSKLPPNRLRANLAPSGVRPFPPRSDDSINPDANSKPVNHNTTVMNRTHPSESSFPQITKLTVSVACLVAVGMLAACSSVKAHVDNGPVKARTFSFLNTGSRQVPGYADDRAAAHAMVQQALIKNLAAKGVAHVASSGDITLAYLIIVGNNSTTTSLNSYFGYTQDAEALVNKVHSEQTDTENARGYFEAGTLVVDIVDPATSKLLQRRSIRAEVLRNLPAETRSARVQTIVDQALEDVPLSQ
jgi:hypothetical protein